MLMRHGVRSALEYAILRASGSRLECDFVCIERPVEGAEQADGGPLRYRVVHRVPLWKAGEGPTLTQEFLEGHAKLSVE
jgi:alkaline phosphatase D